MTTQNILNPPVGSGAPEVVLEVLDVLFAYDFPRLQFDDHEIKAARVCEAMHGVAGDIDRCTRLELVFLIVYERRPFAREYIEVVGAVAEALQTKALAGLDRDALYPQARFVGDDVE